MGSRLPVQLHQAHGFLAVIEIVTHDAEDTGKQACAHGVAGAHQRIAHVDRLASHVVLRELQVIEIARFHESTRTHLVVAASDNLVADASHGIVELVHLGLQRCRR